MSAIAGIILEHGHDVGQAALERIAAAAPGLGPDGVFTRLSGNAGLIRFALHTTPEAEGETAPPVSPRTSSVIAFDGRLDNRADCLALLPPRTAGSLAGRPDSEIILALHDWFGDACLEHLVGDYAFAIWNPQAQRLLLARSPLEMRSLLWTWDGKRFAFGSEPGLLIKGLGLSRAINEGAIGEALVRRFTHATETFWRDLNRVAPGSALSFSAGEIKTWHWHKEAFEDFGALSEADHIARFSALFDQSITAIMRSNGRVAAHVSGGLDSSAIACRAAQLHKAGAIATPAEPLIGRYPGALHDETQWNAIVEQHLGVAATIVHEKPWDVARAQDWAKATLLLPVRPNALATVGVSCERLQQDKIRVLLTGEGGDEWLAGSRAHWPDLLLRGKLGKLAQAAGRDLSDYGFRAAVRALLYYAVFPIILPQHRRAVTFPFSPNKPVLLDWISQSWAKHIKLDQRLEPLPPPRDLPGFAQKHRYARYIATSGYVNYENVSAMAARYGVELRHPFHDLRLTRFLMAANGDFLKHGNERKYLLRQATRGILPEAIRTRQDKAEFSVPIIDGVARYLAHKRPEDMIAAKLGWIDPAVIATETQKLVAWRNQRPAAPSPNNNINALWLAVSADIWLEQAAGL